MAFASDYLPWVAAGDGGMTAIAPPAAAGACGVWSSLGLPFAFGALAFRAAVPQEVGAAVLADGVLLLALLRVASGYVFGRCGGHGTMVVMVGNEGGH